MVNLTSNQEITCENQYYFTPIKWAKILNLVLATIPRLAEDVTQGKFHTLLVGK